MYEDLKRKDAVDYWKNEGNKTLKTKINKTTNECIFILTCIEENSYNKETIIEKIQTNLSLTTKETENIYITTKELLKNILTINTDLKNEKNTPLKKILIKKIYNYISFKS